MIASFLVAITCARADLKNTGVQSYERIAKLGIGVHAVRVGLCGIGRHVRPKQTVVGCMGQTLWGQCLNSTAQRVQRVLVTSSQRM